MQCLTSICNLADKQLLLEKDEECAQHISMLGDLVPKIKNNFFSTKQST